MLLNRLMLVVSLGFSLVYQLLSVLLSWVLRGRGVKRRGRGAGSMDCGSSKSRDLTPSYDLQSPCRSVCRFPNTFHSTWISATLQAVLHLKAVQKDFGPKRCRLLAEVSSMTKLAEVFCSALRDPGRTFTDKEMFGLCQELVLLWQNDSLDLVQPLLFWFQQCGLRTTISVKAVRTCQHCKKTTSKTLDLGNLFVLPGPATKESLPRGDASAHVGSSEEIDIHVEPHQKLTYTLTSVLAHRGHGTYAGHLWTYLLLPHGTIKADNCQVSLIEGRPQELHSSGVLFFYERLSG
nr:uncharacterized protein LOC125990818 [Syngnathus scovelli]